MPKNQKKIVTIGGGTGTFVMLSGLRDYPLNISAIVSMADNGGSTGILREEIGVLPPGDVRRALVALSSQSQKILIDLFNYRFNEGTFNGHSFGNIFLAALEKITGNTQKAIDEASKMLDVKGKIFPSTLTKCHLFAQLENGKIIKGETNIDIPKHNTNAPIKRVWLKPRAKANPQAIKAIQNADFIILGPGDLYTSIIPNLLCSGIKNALIKSKAKKIYIVNLMTKFGETNNFKASDFVKTIEKYTTKNLLDFIIINNKMPTKKRLEKYREEKAQLVEIDEENFPKTAQIIKTDLLRPRGFIRHDPNKLAKTIFQIVF
ncbi:MAG: YvcK family protein [Candidatus Pacebacteria bacterium]|nr:YvcK family protein [Candidatus Paceibacterota bacterium]